MSSSANDGLSSKNRNYCEFCDLVVTQISGTFPTYYGGNPQVSKRKVQVNFPKSPKNNKRVSRA